MEELKERVFLENLKLVKNGLVVLTWGNVSAIDRARGLVVIKPSGVDYSVMKAEDMVVVDMNGNTVEGDLRPSTDLPTHLYLYRAFPEIGGVVHTHSVNASVWAQAGRDIPAYGTTHADVFYGTIPCTRPLTEEEVENAYEYNTGKVIAGCFSERDYLATPAAIVKNHGPFVWGVTPEKAVENAVTLESVAEMALKTEFIGGAENVVPQYLLDKHYFRKHGKHAYYGQEK
ncbi:MAG: L-ribulose-5-phosphate 4-epimerase [Clostridia bacterium]|nr:L-ribulose-5-phosphate 4-epimerase [Clostridia bacterium]